MVHKRGPEHPWVLGGYPHKSLPGSGPVCSIVYGHPPAQLPSPQGVAWPARGLWGPGPSFPPVPRWPSPTGSCQVTPSWGLRGPGCVAWDAPPTPLGDSGKAQGPPL